MSYVTVNRRDPDAQATVVIGDTTVTVCWSQERPGGVNVEIDTDSDVKVWINDAAMGTPE